MHTSHVMRETSLYAYLNKVLLDLPERQRQVLDVFFEYPNRDFTNMELAERLGWSINRVTPCVYELRGLSKTANAIILVESCRRLCRVTGNRAMAWKMNLDE